MNDIEYAEERIEELEDRIEDVLDRIDSIEQNFCIDLIVNYNDITVLERSGRYDN